MVEDYPIESVRDVNKGFQKRVHQASTLLMHCWRKCDEDVPCVNIHHEKIKLHTYSASRVFNKMKTMKCGYISQTYVSALLSNRATACSFPWESLQININIKINYTLCILILALPSNLQGNSVWKLLVTSVNLPLKMRYTPLPRSWLDELTLILHWLTTSWGNTCQKMLLGKWHQMNCQKHPKVQAKSRYSLSSLPFITTRICKTILATKTNTPSSHGSTHSHRPYNHKSTLNTARSNPKVLGRLGNWKLSSAALATGRSYIVGRIQYSNWWWKLQIKDWSSIVNMEQKSCMLWCPPNFQSKKSGCKFGTKMPGRQFAFLQIVSRDVISDPSLTSISVASDKASKSSLSKSPSKVALAAAALSSSCVTVWHASGTIGLLCNLQPEVLSNTRTKHLKWLISISFILARCRGAWF